VSARAARIGVGRTSLDVWKSALSEAGDVLGRFLADPEQLVRCVAFTDLLADTFASGGHVFTCGNGGSHCDAVHFAGEWTGRYRQARPPMSVLALGDASHVTGVANDYGFEHVFSRQVEALGRPGDLLLGFSTSGESRNVVRAMEMARLKGMRTVALLGGDGGRLKDRADIAITIPAQTSDRVQEIHIKIVHAVIEAVERRLFPEHYARGGDR
jgi:D-sedoheptulose 7-phosphate isomerase